MGIQDEDGEDGRWRPGAVGVLLVSEDVGWRDRLGAALRAEGYVVFADDRGEAAFARPRLPIDVAVVDMGIEALSPAAVCAELRSRRPIPILAVQAVERETIVLAAYEAGADQFVPLDASEREFVARIRALLRRVPPERREVIDLRLSAARSISLDPRTLEATVAGTRVA
ncbi:MAG: response regulator transcription factor, partial [Acidimicrobiia bacterium]